MHENCGVVAIIDLEGKQNILPDAVNLLHGVQHRGELGAGICYTHNNVLNVIKGHGPVSQVFPSPFNHISSSAAIGHTRYATNSYRNLAMIQPYHYSSPDSPKEFSFAFNGNIPSFEEQRQYLIETGNAPSIDGDTEIIGRTIIAAMKEKTHESIDAVLRQLQCLDGSFSIVMMRSDGTINALRDKHGFHPLVWGRKNNSSLYAVASEDSAIRRIWADAEIHDVQPGQMIEISTHQGVRSEQLWESSPHTCFFEWIYFGNFRSRIDGVSLEDFRNKCGAILAEGDVNRPMDDMVVPVPESAKIAAKGYAERRGLQSMEYVIVKNKNIGRTFITPHANRKEIAAQKYNINENLLRGRSIILVDDSIVRGTTMRVLVSQLREKGAESLHLRVGAPPITSPCFYGIDFPTIGELLASQHFNGTLRDADVLPRDVLNNIATDIGVDSIAYLPRSAVPIALGKNINELCMACVTGECPTPKGQELVQLAENSFRINTK